MGQVMAKEYKQVTEEDNPRITIQDVATALGISKTTVSRAISGKGRIGEETRQKVLDYIEKHDYKPNPIAKGLAQQRTYNIGWVMPGDSEITDLPFFQSSMSGVCEEAAANDYDVLLSMVYNKGMDSLKRMVTGNKVDGVILARTLVDDQNVRYLKESGIPFVVIGSTSESDVVQIDNDHIAACKDLTANLVNSGLTSLILIGGDDNHVVNMSRKSGYEAGIEDSQKKPVDSSIFLNCEDAEAVEKAVTAALEKQADCIICMDDKICGLALDILRKKKLSVPGDIKLASFYNSDLINKLEPGITAIQYSPKTLGTMACSTLMNYINGEKVPMRTLMSYEILLKESTAIK